MGVAADNVSATNPSIGIVPSPGPRGRQRAVTEYVITELDQPVTRRGAPHQRLDIAFRPAVNTSMQTPSPLISAA